ncbi:catalase [Russula dissimulans]|nr:catalase [Russula dissimulans]
MASENIVLPPQPAPYYTTSYGSPVNFPHASQRASTNGPLLIQDFHTIDVLAHLGRERIPERLVHAKGAGAHGYFEVTHDLSDITAQPLFHQVGKKVDATVRFSTVAGEMGSADTARDTHGFAIKLKTEQGILDWVFLNTPVFFIRDPGKYADLVHATKRNPQTNLKDHDILWDFFSQNPETIHQVMILFSSRGTPDGFHQQHGHGGTTFKLVKEDESFHYVKFHVRRAAGVKTLTAAKATELAGTNPDYGTQLLYDTIKSGNFPEYTVYIQTMTPEQAAGPYGFLTLDVTKVWPHKLFPLRPIGKLVLNRNPENFFDEIEQLAFAPSNLIPYVEHTPDPLLQGRLFIYPDTQRYRLGVNNKQLPCNAPIVPIANYQRAGKASFISQGNRPNIQTSYQGLNFVGPPGAIDSQIRNNHRQEVFDGTAYRNLVLASDLTDRDFEQPRRLWHLFGATEQQNFVDNVAGNLGLVTRTEIQDAQLVVFKEVDKDLARRIAEAIHRPPP